MNQHNERKGRLRLAAIIAFFRDELEARQLIRQLALEASIQSITYLSGLDQAALADSSGLSFADTLHQQGFDTEQCVNCMQALDDGRVAVLLECDDAADMLVALHSYGVLDYHLA
jgi:hypothetical protein